GSQGCQSFALWLGIVPEEKRALAAKVMNDDLVARNFRFTTGNLCTRYLLDMLTEYGYVDSAWELMTRENYPSYGYMLQNGATTVWERFECKTSVIMNSHCHPMYGSVDAWFYSHIAGIKFDGEGCEKVTVKPYFPKSLLSASAEVETVMGVLSVRWMKLWGELSLIVDVPFGMKATVELNGQKTEVGSGLTILKQPLEI
ncbi:MAG: alpha-L-rhamnosidase, partial [Clostridia bacterium]|nr:alpha-L-rhamnosidase [Clostridia bacterium]